MAARTVRAEARTTIRRPVAEVFGWLTEPALLPRWVSGLVASRSEGASELRVGARAVEEVRVRGKTEMMPSEIVELEPDHLITVRIETSDGPCTSRFVLEELGEGCSVVHTMTAEVEGHRWVPTAIMAAGMTRQIRGDLDRLTKLVEAKP
jgi:uncharacterized protein YndB with AHSA1/START domain